MTTIYISHNQEEVLEWFRKKRSFSNEFLDLSKNFKQELGIPLEVPIIMTGHQPILYYPGIFVKLILADTIARLVNGKAYYLVLDTDQENIHWNWIWYENDIVWKRSFLFNSPRKILYNQKIKNNKKNILLRILDEWSLQLFHIFDPVLVPHIHKYVEYCKELLNQDITVSDFSANLNHFVMKELKIEVTPIYVSSLAFTHTFRKIFLQIQKRQKEFVNIYNRILNDFRKYHKIKNPAWPFPDLNQEELPYWISDGKYRFTLNIQDDIKKKYIFPKAITLSFCVRIFLSDLMIHGIGGGFYDVVTEMVIREFFRIEPAPHIVATATLPVPAKSSYPLDGLSVMAVQRQLRKWQWNPEVFLSDSCYLKRKKMFLVYLKNYYEHVFKGKNYFYKESLLLDSQLRKDYKDLLRQLEREPEHYGKWIHKEIVKINHKIHFYTRKLKQKWELQLQKSKEIEYYQKIFFERTYPVFYYDIELLKERTLDEFQK